MRPAAIAINALLITPAADTQKFATRLFCHFSGFTGVGLAQPIMGMWVKKAKAGNNRVPMGSTCAAGFNVILPCKRAKSSPNRLDIQACADSWTESEKTR